MKQLALAGLVMTFRLTGLQPALTGSIEGQILSSPTSAPIRKATVVLAGSEERWVARTDIEGRFRITGVPLGTYDISASHTGFLPRKSLRPVIIKTAAETVKTEIRLAPQGVISGTVRDEDGDLLAGAAISIFKQTYHRHKKQWNQLNGDLQSNDTGNFRVNALAPGRYVVRARFQGPTPTRRSALGASDDQYVATFFPGALSTDAATVLEIGVGTDIQAIDIQLRKLKPQPTYHVVGNVTGVPRNPGIVIGVNLISSDGSSFWAAATAHAPDYGFDILASAGTYTARANVYSGEWEAYAYGNVSVNGDLNGLVIFMNPPYRVTGRIRLSPESVPTSLDMVKVRLVDLRALGGISLVNSDSSGKLIFLKGLPPGPYAIEMQALPQECFLSAVSLDGQQVSPDEFQIQDASHIIIQLSCIGGEIVGVVNDKQGFPVPRSSFVILPLGSGLHAIKVEADAKGTFTVGNLPPGKYKLFSWDEIDSELWQDADFVRKFEDKALNVTVVSHEKKTVIVELIEQNNP